MNHKLKLLSFLSLFALLTSFLIQAQDPASEADDPPDQPPLLEFHTYERGWTRYKNADDEGAPLLQHPDATKFPFAWLVSGAETGDLAYDEAQLDGVCDTEKLKGKSSDIFCVPGTAGMPQGLVYLALWHPESHELVALTTVIDNRAGGAARLRTQPTEPAQPSPAETPEEGKCGPYNPGQWIKAADYAASGLDLPIQREGVGDPITDYACVLPADGEAYLQAYSFVGSGTRQNTQQNNRDEKKSGSDSSRQSEDPCGADDRSGDCDRGGTSTGTTIDCNAPDRGANCEPCTNPLGCDGGNGEG